MNASFSDLEGLTIERIEGLEEGSEQVKFYTSDGVFLMEHYRDCCESVSVEDVAGSVSDLLFTPVLSAYEETSCGENPPDVDPPEYQDSFTWTFYRITTIKGAVTIRWYGESNGYYSEEVSFSKEKP